MVTTRISWAHGMVKQATEKKQFHFSVINGSFMDLFSLNQPSFQFMTVSTPAVLCTPSSYTRPLQHGVMDLFNGLICVTVWI